MLAVAWKNPVDPGITKAHTGYDCSVCEKGFFWRAGAGYYEKSVGKGYAGYEVQFYCCSRECHQLAVSTGMITEFYSDVPNLP